MAGLNPKTWNWREKITSTLLNTEIRDKFLALWTGENAGDLEYYNTATTKENIPIGIEGNFLQVLSGVPAWGGVVKQRQGGSAGMWNSYGTTNYTPSSSFIQVGASYWNGTPSNTGEFTITYPTPFSIQPIVFTSITAGAFAVIRAEQISTVNFKAFWKTVDDSTTGGIYIYWMAIGQ